MLPHRFTSQENVRKLLTNKREKKRGNRMLKERDSQVRRLYRRYIRRTTSSKRIGSLGVE
jgi:hypothetical protein